MDTYIKGLAYPLYTISCGVKYFEASKMFLWMVNFTAALISKRCQSLKKVLVYAHTPGK